MNSHMFMSTRKDNKYNSFFLPLFQNKSWPFLSSGKLLQVKVVGMFALQALRTGTLIYLPQYNCGLPCPHTVNHD